MKTAFNFLVELRQIAVKSQKKLSELSIKPINFIELRCVFNDSGVSDRVKLGVFGSLLLWTGYKKQVKAKVAGRAFDVKNHV